MFRRLRAENPEPTTELEFNSTFELLIAVILSAQATDVSVNKATRELYKIANTPQTMLVLGVDGLKRYIKTIGLFNTKAENIIKTCACRTPQFGGACRTRVAAGVTGRRSQDGERGAEHGVPATCNGGGYAYLSCVESHRVGAGQECAGGRKKSSEVCAAPISSGCTSLADPSRPLYLRSAQAQMQFMSD